jgi:hypothetical protein
VDVNSRDDTVSHVFQLQEKFGAMRVRVLQKEWKFNRMWQEVAWNWASEATTAEWLMFHDADEAIHEDHTALIRVAMANPDVQMIRFPFVHLYATSRCQARFDLTHNTRLGRRSAGYRMRNWCRNEFPNRAVCQMVYGADERNAHLPDAPGLLTLEGVPVMHYGWCRSARALAISQRKHHAWYANGAGLEDGRIPNVAPYDFNLTARLKDGRVTPYAGGHPPMMGEWFESHKREWEELENALG